MSQDAVKESRRGILIAIIGALGAILAGAVTSTVTGVFGIVGQPHASQPVSQPPVSMSADSSSGETSGVSSAGGLPAAIASPTSGPAIDLVFNGEVQLPRLAAVDVDGQGATPVAGQAGPTGHFDIYHVENGLQDYLRVQTNNVYPFPSQSTSLSSVYDICSGYLDSSSGAAVGSAVFLNAGQSFCFATSSGHLAWADIEAVDGGSEMVTVRVRVWDRVVPT